MICGKIVFLNVQMHESCKGLAEERKYVKSSEESPCRKSEVVPKPPKKVRRDMTASVKRNAFSLYSYYLKFSNAPLGNSQIREFSG